MGFPPKAMPKPKKEIVRYDPINHPIA